ncbi:MAG: hydrolase, partial [Coprococcus sp.]
MQEHKYQAREKPVREIEREEKTKIRQEGKGLARDRPIEKVLLEKNITDKETVPAEKEKQEVSAGQRKKKQNTLRSFASHREEDVDGKFTREPVTISEPEKKVEGENGKEELSEHSLRMGNFRGKAKNQSLESESSQRDSRKKKLVQEHARKRKTEGENSVNPEEEKGRKPQDNSLENVREKKQKQKRLQEETARSQKKLSFSDEGNGMIRGAGMGIAKKGISVTASTIENSLQTQETDENAATEGAKQSGILSEKALRYAVKKSRRQAQYHKGRYKEEESVKNSLHFDFVQGTTDNIKTERAGKQAQERKHLLNRFWQKQRYKKARQAAQQGEKTTAEA